MSQTLAPTRTNLPAGRSQLAQLRRALAAQRAQSFEPAVIAVIATPEPEPEPAVEAIQEAIATPESKEAGAAAEAIQEASAAVEAIQEASAAAEAIQESALPTPSQREWAAYLCRLKRLPSVRLASRDGGAVRHWDNLYDYYADQLAVNSTVDTLAQIEYCSARAILIEFAQLLDRAIAEQQSFWNFKRDPEELRLLQTLRQAL